jgi:hypothetical protein
VRGELNAAVWVPPNAWPIGNAELFADPRVLMCPRLGSMRSGSFSYHCIPTHALLPAGPGALSGYAFPRSIFDGAFGTEGCAGPVGRKEYSGETGRPASPRSGNEILIVFTGSCFGDDGACVSGCFQEPTLAVIKRQWPHGKLPLLT